MSKIIKKTLESGIRLYKAHYYDGGPRYESYWLHNRRHREDGPSYAVYRRDGSVWWKEYWLNGKEYSEEDYEAWRLNKEADECIQELLEG